MGPEEINNKFQIGVNFHRESNLDAAEAIYKNILKHKPQHADALHMLGMIYYQRGRHMDAVSHLQKALLQMPNASSIYSNLGAIYNTVGQYDHAIVALNKAISLDASMPMAFNNLGLVYTAKKMYGKAIEALNAAIRLKPTYAEAYASLGIAHYKNDQWQQALECFKKTLEIDPQHAAAMHMLAALSGTTTPSAPPDHFRRLFDDYSEHFESHLVQNLGYGMPALIRQELCDLVAAEPHFENLIDLGCGTGLVGVELRQYCDRMTGVDFSARMLAKTREKFIYDHLHAGDAIDYLDATEETYDLVISADVFPYIGDVYPLMRAIKKCSRPAALFAFSTENAQESDYVLRPTGRYAHSPEYLRKAAKDIGFDVLVMRTENLRKHRDVWIPGALVIFRSQAS